MRIAVIGGGLAGLTAARALGLAGFEAHVLEASNRPGGVIGTTTVDGFVREHAANAFLGGPPRGALALCKDIGVITEQASPNARKRWIYIDGKLRALPQSPLAFVRSDLLTWRGKLALLGEPLRPTRRADDESIHAFAARRLGAEAARAIVAPFVTGVFAADAHDVSLEAGFPKLAELDRAGGIVRGMIKQTAKQMLRKVAGPRIRTTPRGLWAPRGGMGALIDTLAHDLGARVHLGASVSTIRATERGVTVDGDPWDAAVLAVPAEDAAKLVETMPELSNRLASFHRAPAAVVYLGYPVEQLPNVVDGFGFLVALGEDLRVLGVVFESVVWAGRAPHGHVLLRCIFGGSRDPEAAGLDDATLIDQARRDLGVALGVTAVPIHRSVIRARRGIAQYRVGHRDLVRAAVSSARGHRIALAGADYRGPGINDVTADADRVVEEIRSWG
ncbi:MAG: protoporphyrinogen oxidase [Kofleriaceae bacterium]